MALALGATSLVVLVLSARAWRAPLDPEPDDWGAESGWAALFRLYAGVGTVLGAFGLALAVALTVWG